MNETVEFVCSECGRLHTAICTTEMEREEREAKLREAAFFAFGPKLDLTHDARALAAEIDGVTWITNGHIAVPEARVLAGRNYEHPKVPAQLIETIRKAAGPVRLTPGPAGRGAFESDRPCRRLDGGDESIYIAARYHAVLADCDEWFGNGPSDAVLAYLNGVLQGIVIPMLMGSVVKPDEQHAPREDEQHA